MFLGVSGGEEATANVLRERLGVQSRTEFNNNSEAREKFKALVEEYETWKKAGMAR